MFQEERKEFHTWLAQNQKYYEEYHVSPDVIATLALEYGHNSVIVRQWQHAETFKNMGVRHAS